ncbi:MAG: AraC family transcriptional regulator [Pseudomonadota bacterium]
MFDVAHVHHMDREKLLFRRALLGGCPDETSTETTSDGLQFRVVPPGVQAVRLLPGTVYLDLHRDQRMSGFAVAADDAAHAVSACKAPPRTCSFFPVADTIRTLEIMRERRSVGIVLPSANTGAGFSLDPLFSTTDQRLHMADPTTAALADMIVAAPERGTEGPRPRDVDAFVLSIASRLAKRISEESAGGSADWPIPVRAAVDLMESRLDEPLSLGRIAAHAGVSQYHFARIFRRVVGQSVHQYLVQLRVARATHLLRETNMPLAEVAYTAGFGSQSHMTTVIRKIEGRTPGQIRRETTERG